MTDTSQYVRADGPVAPKADFVLPKDMVYLAWALASPALGAHEQAYRAYNENRINGIKTSASLLNVATQTRALVGELFNCPQSWVSFFGNATSAIE